MTNQKGLFESNPTPFKGDVQSHLPQPNSSVHPANTSINEAKKGEREGILNVDTVGSLLKPKVQIEWKNININIPKKVMDVVEMDCSIRPEIKEHYDSLIH